MEIQKNNQSGFTLAELLVAIAIIGLLASIAAPLFKDYKIRAYKASMFSDAKNMRTAVEVYFLDNPKETLFTCSLSNCEDLLPGFSWSEGNCGTFRTVRSTGEELTTGFIVNPKTNNNDFTPFLLIRGSSPLEWGGTPGDFNLCP